MFRPEDSCMDAIRKVRKSTHSAETQRRGDPRDWFLEHPDGSSLCVSAATPISTYDVERREIFPPRNPSICSFAYLLKKVHAASANKASAIIQRDESLIPVFLAIRRF